MLEKVLAGGGVAAAVGASTCCVLPLSLGALGVGGAWLSLLVPYEMALRVAAIVLLGGAFWMVYGWRARSSDGSVCAAVPSQRLTKSALWFGAVLMALVLGSGWWGRFIT